MVGRRRLALRDGVDFRLAAPSSRHAAPPPYAPRVPEPPPTPPPGAHVLSRETELAQLGRFLQAGEPAACLVLLGEPGVGKTTLWEEAIALAGANGLLVRSTRTSEAETALSFAGLGDLLDGVEGEVLAGLPAPHLRAIDVALRRTDAGATPPDPLAICAGFLGTLRLLAARQPLLVAVDDVQWLDASSAEVLAFAARRTGQGVKFLVSRRTGRPSDLERVLEPRGVERLELAGLSHGAVARLLAERLGLSPPRRVLRQLYETSHGNPLFALELGRMLAERGMPDPGAELPFPHVVEDVFGERVRGLAPAARRALLAVALSAVIARVELERLVDPLAVEDAIAAGLLVVERGHVRPSHGLLAAAARHLASAGERRALHRDLAAAVTDPVLHARHLASATATPDAAVATTVAGASSLALERGGLQEAEELAREALRLTPVDSPERVDRVLEAARTQIATGDVDHARELIFSHLEELPRGRARARGYLLAADPSPRPDHVALLERALAEGGDDPEVRADALTSMALMLAVAAVERIDEAERLAREALLAARAAGPEVEVRALPALAWSLVLQGRPLSELQPVGVRPPGGILFETFLERPLAVGLAFRGETAEARSIFEQVAREAEARGEGRAMSVITIQRCELELRSGEVGTAERLLEELGQWVSLDELSTVYGRLRAVAAALRGDPAAVSAWAGKVLRAADPEVLPAWDRLESHRALGIVALFSQDAGEAVSQLAPIWEHTRRHHVRDPGAFPVAGDLVEALLLAGDAAAAREVLEELQRDATEQRHPWGLATVGRCSALLRLHEGVGDEAATTLEEAATEFGTFGLGFDRARCLLALGREQRRSKRSGAARQALEEAAAEFERLGCMGWADQARGELARVSGRRRQSGDDRLTPSERRVADLAAAGRSNKEIAAELFVSVYTVEEHLSHAYSKLGIRSRTQLARALESLE